MAETKHLAPPIPVPRAGEQAAPVPRTAQFERYEALRAERDRLRLRVAELERELAIARAALAATHAPGAPQAAAAIAHGDDSATRFALLELDRTPGVR